MFIGKTDAEAEAPVLWPPDAKSWLTGKDLDARKDWGQEEKGATEDEMVGWHHQLNGHESEQILGDSDDSLVLGATLTLMLILKTVVTLLWQKTTGTWLLLYWDLFTSLVSESSSVTASPTISLGL